MEEHSENRVAVTKEYNGWMAEEVIGGGLADQAYCDEELHKNAAQVLFSKGVWKGELRQYAKDGREIIVEGHWKLINDAGRRIADQHQVIANLTTVDSKKRLGKTLLQLARALGKKDPLKYSHRIACLAHIAWTCYLRSLPNQ